MLLVVLLDMAELLQMQAAMGWDEIIPYSVMCLLFAAAYGLACWLGRLV